MKKLLLVSIALPASAAFAFFLQPRYHNNANALTVLATVFSILAGFLIAVLAMVADERALRGSNWRQDVAYLEMIRRDMERHRAMFYLYLAVLSLAFLGAVDLPLPGAAQAWIERAVLFLAFLAMLWSFRLPGYLTRRHLDAIEQLVRARRDNQTK